MSPPAQEEAERLCLPHDSPTACMLFSYTPNQEKKKKTIIRISPCIKRQKVGTPVCLVQRKTSLRPRTPHGPSCNRHQKMQLVRDTWRYLRTQAGSELKLQRAGCARMACRKLTSFKSSLNDGQQNVFLIL